MIISSFCLDTTSKQIIFLCYIYDVILLGESHQNNLNGKSKKLYIHIKMTLFLFKKTSIFCSNYCDASGCFTLLHFKLSFATHIHIHIYTCIHTYTRYNLFAHSSCTYVFILIFINPQYTVLHILSHCTFYSLFYYLFLFSFSPIFIYIFSCVMFHCFIFFALSIERTCPDLHFTTDYTLYDCVCDE